MVSKVSIISGAYFQLGKNPINVLNPQSYLDMGASNTYDLVVPAILSVFNYKFATKYQSLNKLSTAPADDYYANAFELPTDLLTFNSFETGNNNLDYKLMGSQLWTNEDTVSIYYSYESATSSFHPMFSLYLTYLMCSHLAYPITNKEDVVAYWDKKAVETGQIAISVISSQEPNKKISNDQLISAFQSG